MSVYIIAEAGVNHSGDLNRAKEMIEVAHGLGADAVKFQTFKTENLATNAVGLQTSSSRFAYKVCSSTRLSQNLASLCTQSDRRTLVEY